jgi:hypothetical protein
MIGDAPPSPGEFLVGGADAAAGAAALGVVLNGGAQRQAQQGPAAAQRTHDEPAKARPNSRRRSELLDRLELSELESSVFYLPKVVRSDLSVLADRVMEAVIIILAVQHAATISHSLLRFYFTPLLVLVSYGFSQVTYMLEHWSRTCAYVRNRNARARDEGSDSGVANPQETLLGVRLAAAETLIGVARRVLYLATTYVTFLLVKAILDWINPHFSDGLWVLQKTVVFIIVVVVIFVEFAETSYRQENVARSAHLKSD